MEKKTDPFDQLRELANVSEEDGFTSTDIMNQFDCGVKAAMKMIRAGIEAKKISPAYVVKRNIHGGMQKVRGYVFNVQP